MSYSASFLAIGKFISQFSNGEISLEKMLTGSIKSPEPIITEPDEDSDDSELNNLSKKDLLKLIKNLKK